MKILAIAALSLLVFSSGSSADKPKVNRSMIESAESSVDGKLRQLWPQDPAEVLGLTQGAYINGYGAVFVTEVNLAPAAGITPFHQTIRPDEITRTHDKKMQRIAALRNAIREILVDSAASLDSVPDDQQVAIGVSLFYWKWESREGLPAQIVMHAPKKLLLQAKAGTADKGMIASDEF
jgi:hypothetical protein